MTCRSSTLDHKSTEHTFVVGITLHGGSATVTVTVNGNLLQIVTRLSLRSSVVLELAEYICSLLEYL